MAESEVWEVAPKLVHKTPEGVLARKRAWRRKNLEQARAKGRAAARLFRERRRAPNRKSADELHLYQAGALRGEHLKQRDFVVCLECGEPKKFLYPHLSNVHKLTLQDYLGKWNHPPVSTPSFRLAIGKPGQPRFYLRGRKFDRKTRTWRQTESASDAQIVELRLAGKLAEEIAAEVGMHQTSVMYRLGPIGFPALHPCRFLHGKPVTKKHFLDLCSDFGVDMKTIIEEAGGNYPSVTHHLVNVHPTSVLTTKCADIVLNVRKRWTEELCFSRSRTGKPIREFLASEIRDLPALRAMLTDALNALWLWLRSTKSSGQPPEILNWICDQSRAEVTDSKRVPDSAHAFRTLMFLWPALKDLKDFNERKPSFLAERRFIYKVVDELLARDYAATPNRIRCAARKKLKELDPRTFVSQIRAMGRAGRTNGSAASNAAIVESAPKLSRGRRRGATIRDTAQQIVVAAGCRLQGMKLISELASELYPLQNKSKRHAKDATKKFLRRHTTDVAKEQATLAALSEAQRTEKVNAAKQKLSQPHLGDSK